MESRVWSLGFRAGDRGFEGSVLVQARVMRAHRTATSSGTYTRSSASRCDRFREIIILIARSSPPVNDPSSPFSSPLSLAVQDHRGEPFAQDHREDPFDAHLSMSRARCNQPPEDPPGADACCRLLRKPVAGCNTTAVNIACRQSARALQRRPILAAGPARAKSWTTGRWTPSSFPCLATPDFFPLISERTERAAE